MKNLIITSWTAVRARVHYSENQGGGVWRAAYRYVYADDPRPDSAILRNLINGRVEPCQGWIGVTELKGSMEERQRFFFSDEEKEKRMAKDAIESERRVKVAEKLATEKAARQAAFDAEQLAWLRRDDQDHANGKIAKACDYHVGRTCWVLFEDGEKVVCHGVIHDAVEARIGRKVDLNYFEKKYNGGIIKS